jgi:hypothetical protein
MRGIWARGVGGARGSPGVSRSKMSRLVASAGMNTFARTRAGVSRAGKRVRVERVADQASYTRGLSGPRVMMAVGGSTVGRRVGATVGGGGGCPHSPLFPSMETLQLPTPSARAGRAPLPGRSVPAVFSRNPAARFSKKKRASHRMSQHAVQLFSCSAVQHSGTTEPHISRPVRVHADALVMPGTPVLGRMWSRLSMWCQAGVHLRRGTDSQVKAPSEHPTVPIQMGNARHHCTHGRPLSWPTQLPTKLHGFNKRTQGSGKHTWKCRSRRRRRCRSQRRW